MKLEICCTGLQGAMAAEKAGADRIELCSGLQLGGLTPSFALIKQLKEALQVPVNILIRPREGDFIYNASEISIMVDDIMFCKGLGINGVVIGCLTNDFQIDIPTLKILIEAAGGMDITFHRAFDLLSNPLGSMGQLVALKIKTILTSGQKETAIEGKLLIKELVEAAKGNIDIMAGSGINASNAAGLVSFANVAAIHCSAKKETGLLPKNNHLKGLTESYFVVDENHVRLMKQILGQNK